MDTGESSSIFIMLIHWVSENDTMSRLADLAAASVPALSVSVSSEAISAAELTTSNSPKSQHNTFSDSFCCLKKMLFPSLWLGL